MVNTLPRPLTLVLARSRASTTVPSRAADHPARLARSSTLARASNHPSSTTTTTTTNATNATREHTRVHSTPSPSLSRIASHRIERDAPTTPRARVMRRPPRARPLGTPVARGRGEGSGRHTTPPGARARVAPRRPPRRRLGRVAERGGSRGGTHDESRPVTIARAHSEGRDSIGRSSDRRRAVPRSMPGDDKKRTIVTYIKQ